jgi:antitoxin ParD1/3/4
MDVSLTPESEAWISGLYGSAREVLEEALRLLRERDERRQQVEELKAEIAIGLEEADRGELGALDMEAIKAEGRRRLQETREVG